MVSPVNSADDLRTQQALNVASHLSVVSGSPDEAELAALVAGIAAAVAARPGPGSSHALSDADDTEAGVWTSRTHQRGLTRSGPQAWRWAGR